MLVKCILDELWVFYCEKASRLNAAQMRTLKCTFEKDWISMLKT